MYNKQSLRDTYNRIAEDWHKDHLHDDWWKPSFEVFCSLLSPGAEVLDVGCGGGVKTKLLADRGFAVTGTDLSQDMIRIARREYPGIPFEVLDAREIGSMGKLFDGLYVLAVLLHFPKSEALDLLRAWVACLKPGGVLFVGTKHQREGQPEEEVVHEDDYGYPYGRFFSYYQLDELKSFFEQAGLKVEYENIDPAGTRSWIKLIGRKPVS